MFQQPVTYPVPYPTQVPVPRSIQPFREPETDRRVGQWRNQSIIRTNLLQVFEEELQNQRQQRTKPSLPAITMSNQIDSENNQIQLEGNKRKEIKYADCSGGNVSRPLIPQTEEIATRDRFEIDNCAQTRRLLLQTTHELEMADLKNQQQLQVVQLRTAHKRESIQFEFEEKLRKIRNKR